MASYLAQTTAHEGDYIASLVEADMERASPQATPLQLLKGTNRQPGEKPERVRPATSAGVEPRQGRPPIGPTRRQTRDPRLRKRQGSPAQPHGPHGHQARAPEAHGRQDPTGEPRKGAPGASAKEEGHGQLAAAIARNLRHGLPHGHKARISKAHEMLGQIGELEKKAPWASTKEEGRERLTDTMARGLRQREESVERWEEKIVQYMEFLTNKDDMEAFCTDEYWHTLPGKITQAKRACKKYTKRMGEFWLDKGPYKVHLKECDTCGRVFLEKGSRGDTLKTHITSHH